MTFTFFPQLPPGVSSAALISGGGSAAFNCTEYLLMEEENSRTAFEIRYPFHYNPFKEAAIVNDLLLAGHEGYFYLYDLSSGNTVVALVMDGYFGHLYIHNAHCYVADAGSLICFNQYGQQQWQSKGLGVDGVTVQTFTEEAIYGSGEWDPPGGWIDFVLDIATGLLIATGLK